MGTLSLNRIDHLLWLGRYLERAFTTQRFILTAYDRVADRALDDIDGDWKGQLVDLGFNCETETPLEFFRRCLFNRDNPSSVARSMDAAYDNAIACRDALGTESLGYIQMAVNALEASSASDSPLLDLQLVQDNIMAFKGCIDDFVVDDAARCLVKCGMTVERIDLCAPALSAGRHSARGRPPGQQAGPHRGLLQPPGGQGAGGAGLRPGVSPKRR